MQNKISLLLILLAGLGSPGFAASKYKQALDKKIDAYLDEGIVVGGRSGRGFSLLKVRRDLSTKLGMERVILDIGDIEGKPAFGKVNYFQATVEKNPPRIVLDLAQLSRSAVDEASLKKTFAKSPYVKNVELTSDPEDHSASLVIFLKKPMLVEVFEMPSEKKASRIVLDIKKSVAQNK